MRAGVAIVIGCAAFFVVGACLENAPPDVNELAGVACESSEQCEGQLECVVIDVDELGNDAACFPIIAHEPTSCEDADECSQAGFPVEASCVDGKCTCDDARCLNSLEGDAVEPETCVCKKGRLQFCEDDDECASGSCNFGVGCRGRRGDPCIDADQCASNDCDTVDEECL